MRSASVGAPALALVVLALALPGAAGAEDSDAPPQAFEGRTLPPLDVESLPETRLFPLFSPTRRPPAPSLPEEPVQPEIIAEAPPPPPPELLLVGILATSDGSGVALVKDLASGLTRRVRSGQSVQDWELRVLGPRSMELVHEGTGSRHTLFAR